MFRPADPPTELPLPLLITGVPGVPGFNALDYFQARYPGQVFGLRQVENAGFPGRDIIACDAEDRDGLARVFDRRQFAAVLDCAGNCALKPCELNPELAWKVNVAGVENLVSQTAPRGIRLVHLSVDMVFSGNRAEGGYTEEDPTDPVTVYGKTMVAGEQAVLENDPGACVLRISLPMGRSFSGHAGAIDWITSRFKKSRPATLYFDEIRTPTYTDCMNTVYEIMLAGDQAGIYHLGGPRTLSLYQIAQILNRVGGYDPDCLFGIPRGDAGPIPPRAGNVSMDSGKLIRTLGYNPLDPWPLDDSLVPTHRDWHRQRGPGERGSFRRLQELLCRNPARSTPCLGSP
jgi:dTDP-4-dehydrorhamnose reductase